MSLLCSYQGASSCTGGPQPGARALMSYFLGAYGPLGGLNAGIYSCRDISGSGVLSLHAEGRACDLGVRPLSAEWGWTLARALVEHSRELGIQLVIWDRKIWSGSHCQQGWRDYGGSNPHVDHLHVELSWDAARTLTVADIQATIGGGAAPTTGGIMALPREDDQGDEVEVVQRMLVAVGIETAVIDDDTGEPIEDTRYDGHYGDATGAAVNEFRGRYGVGPTSRVTPWTFYRLVRAVGDLDDDTGGGVSDSEIAAAVAAWLDEHRDELRGQDGQDGADGKTPEEITLELTGRVTRVA